MLSAVPEHLGPSSLRLSLAVVSPWRIPRQLNHIKSILFLRGAWFSCVFPLFLRIETLIKRELLLSLEAVKHLVVRREILAGYSKDLPNAVVLSKTLDPLLQSVVQ